MGRCELRGALTLNHKINKNRTGRIYTYFYYSADSYSSDDCKLINLLDEKGSVGTLQGFASWRFSITPKLNLVFHRLFC
jgi:hypothetical protein